MTSQFYETLIQVNVVDCNHNFQVNDGNVTILIGCRHNANQYIDGWTSAFLLFTMILEHFIIVWHRLWQLCYTYIHILSLSLTTHVCKSHPTFTGTNRLVSLIVHEIYSVHIAIRSQSNTSNMSNTSNISIMPSTITLHSRQVKLLVDSLTAGGYSYDSVRGGVHVCQVLQH